MLGTKVLVVLEERQEALFVSHLELLQTYG